MLYEVSLRPEWTSFTNHVGLLLIHQLLYLLLFIKNNLQIWERKIVQHTRHLFVLNKHNGVVGIPKIHGRLKDRMNVVHGQLPMRFVS